MKTALVIGATGLTGKFITEFLLDSDVYKKVVFFTRREFLLKHAKLVNHIVDFDHIDEWSDLIQGDDLFSALGTTIKQAGSKDAFYKVDYTYQANIAKAASDNVVKRLFLISAPGAKPLSPVFYNRVKGKLDALVSSLDFETLVYFKPSIIYGKREIKRSAERVGEQLLNFTTRWIPGMKKLKPISGEELGRAIVNCAESELDSGIHTFELGKIFGLL